jgi:hypothetical protein
MQVRDILKYFKMWFWRRIEEISWTNGERNAVLQGEKVGRNILH